MFKIIKHHSGVVSRTITLRTKMFSIIIDKYIDNHNKIRSSDHTHFLYYKCTTLKTQRLIGLTFWKFNINMSIGYI